MATRHEVDIELRLDPDGRIRFTVREPFMNETMALAILPAAAIQVGNALIELGQGHKEPYRGFPLPSVN